MPVIPSWRPLPMTSFDNVPPLLVSMEAGPSDYTVRITDMANVWVESLDRRRICMRAWDQNTSIDPSDTPENMSKFLTSLKSALDSSHSGHDQTTLALVPGTSSDSGGEGLVLKINCEIPGLKTLRWTMLLSKAPTSAVATSVVLPLIQAQLARHQEVEALQDLVRRKDSVMTKLLDKLEATGTGLENIFNSLSTSVPGRKKVTRAVAGEKVQGLAPFDRGRWHEEMKDVKDKPSDVSSLLERVFGDGELQHDFIMETDETPGLDDWFHTFQSTKHVPLRNRSHKTSVDLPVSPPIGSEVTADEDDFQVQSTPPRLSSSRGHNAVMDDSTASEEEGSSLPPAPKTSSRHKPHSAKGASQLGTIGGKRQPAKQSTPSPDPVEPQRPSNPPTHDSDTASEADDDPTASMPESSPPRAVVEATSHKGGLGRIGGPKPKASQTRNVVRSPSPDERPKQTSTPKKLGVIGKRSAIKVPDTGDDNARGRSREVDEPTTETLRETSQERADRKREELKRELEKKAAAGPTKKKRKF